MDYRVKVIWKSLLITLLIFGFAVLLNHFMDFLRIDVISEVMVEHELDRDAYLTQQSFVEVFSDYGCKALKVRFDVLKQEIKTVGADLGTYSRFSVFKKRDFDYLKRKYFLLEFEFLNLVNKLNDMCGRPYLPVIFFYSIDDEMSERQGFILEDVSKGFDERVVVLSIDKDYADEPIVKSLISVFNVSKAPTMIVGGKKLEGLVYSAELNATIKKVLSPADPYGKGKDLDFTVRATGVNKSFLVDSFLDRLKVVGDHFARADILFALGRLLRNDSMICSALREFDEVDVNSTDHEKAALVFESVASIDCGRNKAAFYALAAKEWESVGKLWRARIDRLLAEGDKPRLKFNVSVVEPSLKLGNYSSVLVGSSGLVVDNRSMIVSQADRVSRDWLSGVIQDPFSNDILTVFSERFSWPEDELNKDIGWHEGGRIKDLLSVGAKHEVAVGTLVAEKDGRWFAPDENGVFRFEVPLDKVLYPTTRFLRDDLAVIIDTHGVNMLVEQAISKNASLVVGCCDHPAKVAAAEYLSSKGIDVVCFTDKYLYLLLGHDVRVVGSPPVDRYGGRIVLGMRPLVLSVDDKIVVSNSSNDIYALWYYQTPANYFTALSKVIPLKVFYYSLKNFSDQKSLIRIARLENADFIATRVYNKFDYDAVKRWLAEDVKHKAILFHSSAYPFGLKLFQEFPEQTSFDDPNPVLS